MFKNNYLYCILMSLLSITACVNNQVPTQTQSNQSNQEMTQENQNKNKKDDFFIDNDWENIIQTRENTQEFDKKQYLLHGKWHCEVPIREDINYHFDVNYQTDGTFNRKGLIIRDLIGDLKYQFEHNHQGKWQIRKDFYQEITVGNHEVKLIPENNPKKSLALQTLEKNNPDALIIKNEMPQDLQENWQMINKMPFTIKNLNQQKLDLEMGGLHGVVFTVSCNKMPS